MSMSDPIADMLARIRNAQKAGHPSLLVPRSKIKVALAQILKNEGFIEGYVENQDSVQGTIKIFLRYDAAKRGLIRGLRRVSRPSRRVYVGKREIPRVRDGLGVTILTTPRGLLTDHQARVAGVGGEVVCEVW